MVVLLLGDWTQPSHQSAFKTSAFELKRGAEKTAPLLSCKLWGGANSVSPLQILSDLGFKMPLEGVFSFAFRYFIPGLRRLVYLPAYTWASLHPSSSGDLLSHLVPVVSH